MTARIAAAVAALIVGVLIARKIFQSTPTAPAPFVVTHHVDLDQLADPPPPKVDVPPPEPRRKPMLVELHFRNTKVRHARYQVIDGSGLPVTEDDIPTDGSLVSLVLSPDHYDVRVGGDRIASFDLRYRREDRLKLEVAVPKKNGR